MLLLVLDLLIALGLRGLLRPARVAAAVLLRRPGCPGAHALDSNPNPALATRLGYIEHRRPAAGRRIAAPGWRGCRNTSTGAPRPPWWNRTPVEPGKTDLSFYPLLYWPIGADAQPLTPVEAAALNDYMSRGGIILIDTRDSGSGAGFAPGSEVGAAAGRARTDHSAARAADHRARAGARVLPAAGFSGPLHRRHRLGAARPGPHQRQRQPGDHRRQRLGGSVGDRRRAAATRMP